MTVIHVVLFKLPAHLSPPEIKEVGLNLFLLLSLLLLILFCDDMLSLRTSCVRPESKQPYIITSSGGKDNSPENLQQGLTHAFVVEFASVEDRDYYVKDDPSHQAFVKKHREHIEAVTVVDYEKGVY